MGLGLDPRSARIGGPRQVGDRIIFPSQLRLTLQTGTPVMTTTQSAKTTIFLTPYIGRMLPIWTGRRFEMIDVGGELSNVTTATAAGYAGPAVVANNSNYDLFAWGRHGKGILTRGAAWNSATARSSGTENDLEMFQGIYVNKNKITNGPPARQGTYVGTVRSNGSAQIDWIVGAADTAGSLGVWNMYNRVLATAFVTDSTNTWEYTTATWRQAGGLATNQISAIIGLSEDAVDIRVLGLATNNTSTVFVAVGVGVNSTSANSSPTFGGPAPSAYYGNGGANYVSRPGIGWYTFAWLEISAAGVGITTWAGDAGGALMQSGMTGSFWM